MKKVLFALAAACAVTVTAVGGALASGGGGIVVDRGTACGILDGNGNVFVTNNSVTTVYSNQQGSKAVLQCEDNGAPAAHLTFFTNANTGLVCGTLFGGTTNWVDKVGRNGNSQLTCTVDLSDADSAASSSTIGLG